MSGLMMARSDTVVVASSGGTLVSDPAQLDVNVLARVNNNFAAANALAGAGREARARTTCNARSWANRCTLASRAQLGLHA
jgi:hypothetical protein